MKEVKETTLEVTTVEEKIDEEGRVFRKYTKVLCDEPLNLGSKKFPKHPNILNIKYLIPTKKEKKKYA